MSDPSEPDTSNPEVEVVPDTTPEDDEQHEGDDAQPA
jgi:hypothetical protein